MITILIKDLYLLPIAIRKIFLQRCWFYFRRSKWSEMVANNGCVAFYNDGFPMAFSNEIIKPNCTVKDFKNGSFCPNGEGIGNYSLNPQSGDASHTGSKQTTYEIKYVSDLDGPFNFLVGAIDISQSNNTMYDVYASGITGNGLLAPGSIAGNYRDAYNGLIFCHKLQLLLDLVQLQSLVLVKHWSVRQD